MQRECIVVLGMHRSGTSAVSGALSALGIHPSDALLPAVEDVNPKGFWEHAEIISIHDQLLESLDSSWHDVNALPNQWWLSPLVIDFRNKIVSILRRDFSNLPIWLIKDPRMCRLLPLWQHVFRELGCQPLYVLALRNPAEVALSLRRRNDLAEEASCLLWLTHMLEAEYQTRSQLRAFVNYERLLSDWRGTMFDISQPFSLTWPIAVEDAAPYVEAFLDTSLRHHVGNATLPHHPACRLAQEGFNLLSAPSPDPVKLDLLRTQTEEIVNLIGPLSKQLQSSEKHNQNLRALESENTALRTEIKRIKGTVSWQLTKPLRLVWNKLLRPVWNMLHNLNTLLRPVSNTFLRFSGRQTQGNMSKHHPRAIMARHHLSGEGIEIGAMHFPVWRHPDIKVRYVDNTSREDSIQKFPDLGRLDLVSPDYIEDGFTLASLADSSQDFLIANHVLEHASNPLGVLTNWARVLRPGGSMLLSVPIAEACFDRGRQITSLEHLRGDYRVDPHELSRRNLNHYLEWISISEPAIRAMKDQPPKKESIAERMARAENMCRANLEIHFHTFSTDSFRQLLEYFAHSLDGRFKVAEIRDIGGEVIAVISLPVIDI